jgi:hypothetical protein
MANNELYSFEKWRAIHRLQPLGSSPWEQHNGDVPPLSRAAGAARQRDRDRRFAGRRTADALAFVPYDAQSPARTDAATIETVTHVEGTPAERDVEPGSAVAPVTLAEPAPLQPSEISEPAAVPRISTLSPIRWGWIVLTLTLAASLAGFLGWRLQQVEQRLTSVDSQSTALRQTAREMGAAAESLRVTNAEALALAVRTQRVVDVLVAGDLRIIPMSGSASAPLARGQALWSESRGLVVVATHLPPAGEGIYQAWMVSAGARISLGPVSPDGQGQLTTSFDPPRGLAGVPTAFMLTLESQRDSTAPSPTVIISS